MSEVPLQSTRDPEKRRLPKTHAKGQLSALMMNATHPAFAFHEWGWDDDNACEDPPTIEPDERLARDASRTRLIRLYPRGVRRTTP